MGLIDFVKNAGEKIFGGDKKDEPRGISADQQAEFLRKAVKVTGIEVRDLHVAVNDDVVTVGGSVSSRADKERLVLVLGNTRGIARVDDRLQVVAAAPADTAATSDAAEADTVVADEPKAIFYTVQSGDSLSKIAKEHYGNAMKYPVIFEANKPMLSDPDKIYPGQVLRIPPLQED